MSVGIEKIVKDGRVKLSLTLVLSAGLFFSACRSSSSTKETENTSVGKVSVISPP